MELMKRWSKSLRSGWLRCSIAGALATPQVSLGAEQGETDSSREASASATNELELEVRVDREIDESEILKQWIDEESRAMLTHAADYRGTVSIAVEGELYAYTLKIATRRDGGAVGPAGEWDCECSNEELLGEIRRRLPDASRRLRRGDSARSSTLRPTRPEPDDAERSELAHLEHDGRRSLGARGRAGIAMMTVGAVGAATGATLLGIGRRKVDRDGDPTAISTRDYAEAGRITASTGGGLLVLGVALIVSERIAKKRNSTRRHVVLPSIEPDGSLALTLKGTF